MRCHHLVWIGACPICKPIQTHRDLLWNFTWRDTGPKGGPPMEIHSKRQFLRECRQRNLTWVGREDLQTRGEYSRPTRNKHDVTQLIKQHGRAIVESAKQKARKEGVAWG